jgi:hypothetical protein
MNRLIEKIVLRGFVIACRRATWPTSRSPSFVNATTDGVVRPPSAFGITTGSPPSITATTEFVVPRSMPMTFAMLSPFPVFARAVRPGAPSSRNATISAHVTRRRATHMPPSAPFMAGTPAVIRQGPAPAQPPRLDLSSLYIAAPGYVRRRLPEPEARVFPLRDDNPTLMTPWSRSS